MKKNETTKQETITNICVLIYLIINNNEDKIAINMITQNEYIIIKIYLLSP